MGFSGDAWPFDLDWRKTEDQRSAQRSLVWTGDSEEEEEEAGEQQEEEEVLEEKKEKEEVSPPYWSSSECGSDEGPARPLSGCGDGSASRSCNTHHTTSQENTIMREEHQAGWLPVTALTSCGWLSASSAPAGLLLAPTAGRKRRARRPRERRCPWPPTRR